MASDKGEQFEAPNHLSDMPRDELIALALELGLAPEARDTPGELATMIEQRRRLLERLDRNAMLEVVAWGRRPVRASAGKEELARQIGKIERMHFDGLSRDGLYVLVVLRGIDAEPDAEQAQLIRALKHGEGLFRKLGRKRRRLVGKLIGKMLGDSEPESYKFLPEGKHKPSLKEQIEERGLVGGLADKLRGAADDYIAVKLDEIETRIDRKLDDIDRRLAQWRDREIANRLRIIKITLAASIIVAIISVAYAWIVKNFFA